MAIDSAANPIKRPGDSKVPSESFTSDMTFRFSPTFSRQLANKLLAVMVNGLFTKPSKYDILYSKHKECLTEEMNAYKQLGDSISEMP